MATITDIVRPGDVISSDLIERIIALLNAHDAQLGGGAGGIVVPNLFGRTITEARVILQLQQLVLGSVVDVFGTIVNASAGSATSLMVLNQVPVAGAGTVTGGAVSVVVSGQSGGTNPPPVQPQINLVVPAAARVGTSIELRGTGLGGAQSAVTFDGIAGTVLGTSNMTSVFVTVPSGIPGAPALPGAPDKPGVVIKLTVPSGAFATNSVTIQAPLTNPLAITSIQPNPANVGGSITIVGTGFSTTANQNVVNFGSKTATPTTVPSATQMSVTVPTGIPGLVTPGDSTTVNVTVTRTTDNAVSNALPLSVDL